MTFSNICIFLDSIRLLFASCFGINDWFFNRQQDVESMLRNIMEEFENRMTINQNKRVNCYDSCTLTYMAICKHGTFNLEIVLDFLIMYSKWSYLLNFSAILYFRHFKLRYELTWFFCYIFWWWFHYISCCSQLLMSMVLTISWKRLEKNHLTLTMR